MHIRRLTGRERRKGLEKIIKKTREQKRITTPCPGLMHTCERELE
jgi:hypothetical protein